ncbi:alpha/beta fold hydrolase [Cellulomonas sp. SG140]|uniref:alpha/beta fold hydrolase n=1 Tax=Cellulomonas sp. SG140 TaxID=2976536 RepID=UPI0021E7583F|nr:alpha/beta hydrolase [Cellulomonas sp. SG140]
MRDVPGRRVAVNGRSVYVEESGEGDDWVVFESGAGAGRTSWDPVLPFLTDTAHLVTYDRAGRPRTEPVAGRLSIEEMADDLVAMTEAVVPRPFVLVAHSMGGLVARRAAERLGPRLRALLLVDPTPETSPVYDDWDARVAEADRMMAVMQVLTYVRPLRGLFLGNLRTGYSPETCQAILDEDFTPAGTAQTRKELRAVADGIRDFRGRPPAPPACPVIVLAATRPVRQKAYEIAFVASAQDHDRRYAQGLANGRFEAVDSAHLVQAERPEVVAGSVRELLAGVGPHGVE